MHVPLADVFMVMNRMEVKLWTDLSTYKEMRCKKHRLTCWIDTNSWPTNPDQILDSNYLKSLFKTLHFNNKQKICEMFGSNAWSELSPERPEKTKQKRTKSDFFKENKMEDLTCYVNHNSICTLLFFSCYPPSRSYSPVRFGNDRFIFVWTYVFLIILRPPLF